MSVSSRRVFLTQSAALLTASKLALGRDALHQSNLGVELYTVRNIINKDPRQVLQRIKDIGYGEVEATADILKKDWSAVHGSGLRAISVHLNTDPTDAELADAKQKGFEYAVIPYIPVNMRGGVDVMKKLAAKLNEAGKRAQAHGLQLCYHNHAFEFQPMDGTRPLDIILGETQPELLKLEMDIFWVTIGGNDPVELLKKYSGRVPLLHLKDKKKGQPAKPQYNETVPPDTFKEIGNGSIDIPAVLKAADSAGVKHYFVEQDQSPNPIQSLRESYQYLSKFF